MKDFMEGQLLLAPWHFLIWVLNMGGGGANGKIALYEYIHHDCSCVSAMIFIRINHVCLVIYLP